MPSRKEAEPYFMDRIRLILFLFFLLMSNTARSQHCPYDGAYIMVVEITAKGSSKVIPNLNITLLDSLGETVLREKWANGKWIGDTLKLWQNPQKTTHSGIIDNENPMNPWSIRFWFAENNYVLVTGMKLPGTQLKIEDVDGEKNQGQFETKIIHLPDFVLFPLCTGQSQWDRGEELGFVKDYQPIKVELKEK